MNPIFKIQHLRFLVAVVDAGGVIKAAERLHLSQPSISAGLKALECGLGRPLFDRSGPANRPPRLTPEGRRFYRHAIEILKQCEAARAALVGGAEARAQLRTGILDTLPQDAVHQMFHRLGERGSDVQLDIWEGSADRVAGWLAQKRVDVAWTQVADFSPNTLVLWREPLVAVVAPAHPFATASGRISVRDLGKQPFIHRSRCELDALGRAQLKAAAVSLDVRARIEREDLAFQLVRSNAGITLAPKSLVPDDLIAVAVQNLTVMRSIGLQWQEELDPMLLATVCDVAKDVASMVAARLEGKKKTEKKTKKGV